MQLERKHEKWRRSVQVGAEMVSGAGADVATSIFDFDEEEVARQLTLREFLLYREIKSSELLDQVRAPFSVSCAVSCVCVCVCVRCVRCVRLNAR